MFKVNRVLSAAYVAFGIAVVGATYMPSASAQSNTTGTIFGQAPEGATSVVIESLGTGARRTLSPDSGRRFQATALPPGRYKVQLLKGDAVSSSVEVEVLLGQGTEAVFAAASQLEKVQVVGGTAAIDVSNTNNGSTFTAKQLSTLPIQDTVNSIIQLAPNTTRADPRYSGGASIGGGGASENSYYINGFPVTNALTQLGSIELPFAAISQAQILTGGFGAEFGRSVGGVVNITTKSGTNKWEAGGFISFEPDSLRSNPRNIHYPMTGDPENVDTDGTIYLYRKGNKRSETQYGAYLGGPIVNDRLFFFFAGDEATTRTKSVVSTPTGSALGSSGWAEGEDKTTRYLTKFDWYLNNDNLVELTLFGDNYKSEDSYYGYSYANNKKFGPKTYTEFTKNLAGTTPGVGGDGQILKYTGNWTSDLTVTALIGQSKSKHSQSFDPSASLPSVAWTTTGRRPDLLASGAYFNPSPLPAGTRVIGAGAQEKTEAARLDFEYKLGKHTIRAGLDEVTLKSKAAGDIYAGGSVWQYRRATSATTRPASWLPTLGALGVAPHTDGNYYFARQIVYDDTTAAESKQSAQYIEDRYQINNDVQVTVGVRRENFKNLNGDGEVFLESKNFISPRFAASWDVNGDSSLKVYGSAGRYSLQLPTRVAIRGASRSTFTYEYGSYTGVDPVTGQPTGFVSFGAPYSSNNEYGQPKDPKTLTAIDIKPTYQDEITLGFEKALTAEYNGGARITYRKQRATIDDLCDYRAFNKYADDNGIDRTNYSYNCQSFNPGRKNSFWVDYAGNGTYTKVTLSPAELGFEEARRSYMALDFFLEHPFKNGWYGKVNYTYSKNKGNTEGQTNSDVGQEGVAATITWDTPELMENKNGLLPNDREHQIKAYGYYQLNQNWMVGLNFLAASGRPKYCLGNYVYATGNELDGGNLDYGSLYGYCDQKPVKRGSLGRLPWEFRLDGNVTYMPDAVKGLAVRLDVFNLFNRQSVQAIEEVREADYDPTVIAATYGRVLSYTTPRYMKLTIKYDHAF